MPGVELVEGIDRRWLEAAAQRDPISHAYAVWDLERTPEKVRFISCLRSNETIAYLLIWSGRAAGPVVHWVGNGTEAEPLLERSPLRPLQMVVPAEIAPLVRTRYAPTTSEPLLILQRSLSGEVPPPAAPGVRRLRPFDRPAIEFFVHQFSDPLLQSYAEIDPGVEPIWGAFSPESDALLGVAKTAARLPAVWVITGVFVSPEARGRGLATALVTGLVGDASRVHAASALYVLEANQPARRAYERVGFGPFGRRIWIDAGVQRLPTPP